MALRFWRSSVRGPKMTKASANACHTWAQMTNHCSPPVTVIAPPSLALLCPKIQALVQRSGLQVIQRTLASFGTGSRSLLRCCWVRKLEKPRHHFWWEMPEKKVIKIPSNSVPQKGKSSNSKHNRKKKKSSQILTLLQKRKRLDFVTLIKIERTFSYVHL